MKPLFVWLALLCMAAPAFGSPLFSGTDSSEYDVLGVTPYSIPGTHASVLLIKSRAVSPSHDYVVTLRSMAASSNKKLIAEVRFKDGQEEGEPYAVWLDSCFAENGTICNSHPGHAEPPSLAKLIHKIADIMREHPQS